MNEYCYLASVYDGEIIHVVQIDKYSGIVAGDLIRLSNGILGKVTHIVHVRIGDDDYNFIAAMKPIESDWSEFYHFGGTREVSNVSA
jgi:hypothetical protein